MHRNEKHFRNESLERTRLEEDELLLKWLKSLRLTFDKFYFNELWTQDTTAGILQTNTTPRFDYQSVPQTWIDPVEEPRRENQTSKAHRRAR